MRIMFERNPPIRSTQEDIPELAEDIDRFVIQLGERLDEIQDAELAGCVGEVSSLARQLAGDALRLGYPLMAQVAKSVGAAADDEKAEAVQEGVFELTDLVQRVRRGHRGAA
jgi:hypothetical protein